MVRLCVAILLIVVLVTSNVLTGCARPSESTAEWHSNQGAYLVEESRYDEAIKECSEAIELAPDFAEAYSKRGIAYVQKGELDQAIADFDKAIELDPELAKAYNDRGYAYYVKGEVAKAVSDFEKCIELSNDPRLVAKAQQLLDELR